MRKINTFVGPGLTDLLVLPKFEGAERPESRSNSGMLINDSEEFTSSWSADARRTVAANFQPRTTMQVARIHAARGTVPHLSNGPITDLDDEDLHDGEQPGDLLRRWSGDLLRRMSHED